MGADRQMVRRWMGDRNQRVCAKALGITQQYLSLWLREERDITRTDVLKRMAEGIAPEKRNPRKHRESRLVLLEGAQ